MANSTAASTEKKQMSSNNLIIVMVLISLLAIGVTGVAAKFLIGSIVLDSHVLKAKSTADKNVKQDVTNAPELINSFNALGSEAGVLNDALPSGVDYPSLIVEMENMAGTAGLTLSSVNTIDTGVTSSQGPGGAAAAPAPSTTPGTTSTTSATTTTSANAPQSFTFTITTTGSYDAIQRMLTELEASVRPMEVTGVQLNGVGSNLQSTINLTTWYEPPATLPFGTETVK